MASIAKSGNIITGKVRLSYAHLFTPEKSNFGEGAEKYGVTLLIPKDDAATMAILKKGIGEAVERGMRECWRGVRPPSCNPVQDGDGTMKSGSPWGEECRGSWVLRTSTTRKPVVYDVDKTETTDPDVVYSGCWAYASIRFFPYAKNGNRGISTALCQILKAEDGPRFDGGGASVDDFAEIEAAVKKATSKSDDFGFGDDLPF